MIEGYENLYLLSDRGRVIGLSKEKPILRKMFSDRAGYQSVILSNGKIKKKKMVHWLVAKHFVSNPGNKPEVNHKDSNPNNNVYENLEWVTPKENVKHAILNSYATRGGKHWKSKLTTENADFIREKFKNPYSAKELSRMFDTDLSNVYSILRGETWNKHDSNAERRIFKRGTKLE